MFALLKESKSAHGKFPCAFVKRRYLHSIGFSRECQESRVFFDDPFTHRSLLAHSDCNRQAILLRWNRAAPGDWFMTDSSSKLRRLVIRTIRAVRSVEIEQHLATGQALSFNVATSTVCFSTACSIHERDKKRCLSR